MPPCASCGKPASKCCDGCSDAPTIIDDGVTEPKTYYCSRVCQKEHWKAGHKEHCQNLKSRKAILRAAQILQQAMLSIRRHATETEFTTMVIAEDPDEGVTAILLEGYAWRYEGHRIVPGPFTELPNDLDRDTVEGIMMWGTGELALGYLGVWIEQLLSAPTFTVEEVHVAIDERTKTTLGIMINSKPKGGLKGVELLHGHALWRVTLPQSGEIWAVDITGIQFGYRELVYPWSKVEAPDHRAWKVERTYSIGANVSMFLRLQQSGRQEIFDLLNLIPPGMAHVHGGEGAKFSKVMEAPEVRKKILDYVDLVFKDIVPTYFSPERIERHKKADEAAALGPETPEYQRQVKDLRQRIYRQAEKVAAALSEEEKKGLRRTYGTRSLPDLHPYAQYYAVGQYIIEAEKIHRSGHWVNKGSEESTPGPRKLPPIYAEVMSDFFPKRTWPKSVFEVPKSESTGTAAES